MTTPSRKEIIQKMETVTDEIKRAADILKKFGRTEEGSDAHTEKAIEIRSDLALDLYHLARMLIEAKE